MVLDLDLNRGLECRIQYKYIESKKCVFLTYSNRYFIPPETILRFSSV